MFWEFQMKSRKLLVVLMTEAQEKKPGSEISN